MLDRVPRTRQALEDGIRAGLHFGAQLYASLDGEVAADGAVGENLTPDHLMLWLSSTKPVAAVAIAQIWERGRLELDDPVARHIPEFAVHGKDRITLRHLLTHTAGIRMLDTGWPREPWEAVIARICAMKPEPRWVPGEKAGYHQASSWFVLGEVIRRIDGRPFDRYVREEIFEPLGMSDSWVGMPRDRYLSYKEAGRIAAIWNMETSEPHGWDSEERCTSVHPGGNGYGPMRELGRFYEMLLGRGGQIISPQSVEALTVRHRVGMMDSTFKHVMDWGLGFIPNSAMYGVETVPYAYGHHASRRAVGHSGYRSSVAFADPEHGLAVALAFDGTPSNEAHEQRIRTVLDALYEDVGRAPKRDPAG